MPPPANRWLLREPSPTAPLRLFCLPYAGAGASVYRRWPVQIGPLEVCPLQLPGRENRLREPAPSMFPTFAADAATALAPYLDRPFAVFGHCMGALLAHALVTHLASGSTPKAQRLIVSSSRVPHWSPPRRYRLPTQGSVGVYHPSMNDTELGAEVTRVVARQGGELGTELLPLAVRVLRQDLDMCFGYDPGRASRTRCEISTVAWTSDADVSTADMAHWAECGEVTAHVLPGDKLAFTEAPEALLRLIETDVLNAMPARERVEVR